MTRTRSRRVDAAVALASALGSAAGLHAIAEPLARSAPAPATYLDRLSSVLFIEADRPVAGQTTILHNGLRTWLRFAAIPLRPGGVARPP